MQKSIKPNFLQRAFHRILMLRPATFVLIRILHRADSIVLKWTSGRFTLPGILAGLPTFRVTTIGAKSKLPRPLPLAGFPDGDKIALIASNFGQAHHPAWYHNLKANPECWVQIGGVDRPYIAHEAEGAERNHFWNMAVSYYVGYTVYEKTAGSRRIPVMVLEPKKELSDS